MLKTNEEKQDILSKLSIYKLREFARGVGVRAPTSKNKPELTKEIKMIKNKELEPYKPKIKSGRPVISHNFYSDYNISLEKYRGIIENLHVLKKAVEEQISNMEEYIKYLQK